MCKRFHNIILNDSTCRILRQMSGVFKSFDDLFFVRVIPSQTKILVGGKQINISLKTSSYGMYPTQPRCARTEDGLCAPRTANYSQKSTLSDGSRLKHCDLLPRLRQTILAMFLSHCTRLMFDYTKTGLCKCYYHIF